MNKNMSNYADTPGAAATVASSGIALSHYKRDVKLLTSRTVNPGKCLTLSTMNL